MLVNVRLPRPGPTVIKFSYVNEVTEYDVGSTWGRPRPSRRHLSYASPPASFRIHVPWAKRTAHYTFSMEAPECYFFARQAVLINDAGAPKAAPEVADPERLQWSVTTSQGRRIHAFLMAASSEREQIYLGLQSLEIPGRSTSRAFSLSWFVTLTLVGFSALVYFGADPELSFQTGALVLALLAVGAFISTPTAGPGVLGFPLLSRFAPRYLAFGLVIYILWLGYRQEELAAWARTWMGTDVLSVLRPLWDTWILVGGAAVILGCGALAIYVSRRRLALIRNYRRASLKQRLNSPGFY